MIGKGQGMVIFGKGWLGTKLHGYFPESILTGVDICDKAGVRVVLNEYRPTKIINAAGKTGKPNIDWCVDHPAATYYSNVAGPLVLLAAIEEYDEFSGPRPKFVHLSSGCLWYDNGLWVHDEFSETDLGSTYSGSKAKADELITFLDKEALCLRLRMPFDSDQNPRNLLTKLSGFDKITGVANSLTYVPDLCAAVDHLMSIDARGIFNVVNDGPVTHWEIAELYKKHVDPEFTYERIPSDSIRNLVTEERSNCILCIDKLRETGYHMPPTLERLNWALENYGKSND